MSDAVADLVGGEGDSVEARGAEAVDGAAGDGDGQVGPERGLAGDVAAGGAFGIGAADIDVLDFAGFEFGAFDSVFDRVAGKRRAVGHVEAAALGFREPRASCRNDYRLTHVVLRTGSFRCNGGTLSDRFQGKATVRARQE